MGPGLLDAWAARVAKEHHAGTMAQSYNQSKYSVKAKSAITDRGTLEIAGLSGLTRSKR
jgi:hypothetical protein